MNLSRADKLVRALSLLEQASKAKGGFYLQPEDAEEIRWLLHTEQDESEKKSAIIARWRALLEEACCYIGIDVTSTLLKERIRAELERKPGEKP